MLDPVRPRAPQQLPIECDRGAVFYLPLGFYDPDAEGNPDLNAPQNLSGKSFEFKVRESQSKRSKLIATGTTIEVNLAQGKIAIEFTSEALASIAAGEYYYHLWEATQERYYLEGSFRIIGH